MISSSIIVISGIVIVLAVTIFFGFIFNTMYNNLTIEHWLPQTIIVGIIITSLATCAGIIDNNNSKVKKSIENTIASNYDNVLDYHKKELLQSACLLSHIPFHTADQMFLHT